MKGEKIDFSKKTNEFAKQIRDSLTFNEAKQMLIMSRSVLVEMLDLAREHGDITSKERNVMYRRMIDWNSLETVGKEFGVTRERIRQIEAKVEEKIRILTGYKL